MPLVLKIKYEETLRRWVVPEEASNELPFSLTLQTLKSKIRDLFNLSPFIPLNITYVDKENDVITLGDDQDIVDACVVQQLNPLRLEVRIPSEQQNYKGKAMMGKTNDNDNNMNKNTSNSGSSNYNLDIETLLKALPPQATVDSIKTLLQTHITQFVDPKLTIEVLNKAEESFKGVINRLNSNSKACKPEKNSRSNGDEQYVSLYSPREKHYKETREKDVPEPTIHPGVTCDRCDMSPIAGPRYRSTKMFDYDLCSNCFEADGSKTDYQKLDYPVSHPYFHSHHPDRYHHSYRGPSKRGMPRPYMVPQFKNVFSRGSNGLKFNFPSGAHGSSTSSCPAFSSKDLRKLDASLVKDVTIFDGTELSPKTKVTKIWRVSNSGAIAWPRGIQLVHIGGDNLSTEDVVNVKLPEGGLACGEDVEVSIDLLVPEMAGRYVSHWRLASPFGQKFGHRLWVVIQVVPASEQSPQFPESLKRDDDHMEVAHEEETLNEVNNSSIASSLILVNEINDYAQPIDAKTISPVSEVSNDKEEEETSTSTLNLIDMVRSESLVLEAHLAVDDFLYVKAEFDDGFSLVEKPTEKADWIGLSPKHGLGLEDMKEEVEPKESVLIKETEAETMGKGGVVDKVDVVEEMHLQSLESMGFSNRNLNLLLLQKNDHNLQRTVDDLLAASGWYGALKDLEEMGFTDQSMNIRILVKNNGSIKRAVKDLVNLEKL